MGQRVRGKQVMSQGDMAWPQPVQRGVGGALVCNCRWAGRSTYSRVAVVLCTCAQCSAKRNMCHVNKV